MILESPKKCAHAAVGLYTIVQGEIAKGRWRMEWIAGGVLIFVFMLAVTKRQDNDALGQQIFTPEQLQKENAGSNVGFFLGALAIGIILTIMLSAGG